MPRPKKPDGQEPKSRSRNGCWSCKARKVKCTEERPSCSKCIKGGYQCDYGIRLNWDGRRSKRPQLKAVHLGAAPLDGFGDNDDNYDDDDADYYYPGPGNNSAAPGVFAGQKPALAPLSQHQTQFQLDPTTSPPSSSSSAFSATPSGGVQPMLNLSFQVQTPARFAMPRRANAGSTSQFPVAPPPESATITSPIMAQFDGTSTANPLRTSSKRVLPTVAPPLQPTSQPCVPASTAESVSSGDTGDVLRSPSKRQRIDSDVSERDFSWTWPLSPSTGSGSVYAPSPQQLIYPPVFAPARPAADTSSPRPGDENHGLSSHVNSSAAANANLAHLNPANDFRRLSVSSLLSGPFDHNPTVGTPPSSGTPPIPNYVQSSDPSSGSSSTMTQLKDADDSRNENRHHYHRSSFYYGIDGGFQDLDLGKNDDANALSGVGASSKTGKTFGIEQGAAHMPGGYYEKQVAVRIPRALGTLPAKLTDNPMNLLYFHHFINNTARVLVPHDDPQSNPFRTILPQMAINNDNLLSLLLAYSASHRARMLDQTEPVMRIALWVQDIFPALRNALDDQKQKISNANVATAIMLASLAIVSPTAFGYDIPWQRHLMLARELIATRPEGLRVDHHSSSEGQVCSFLWSWFAYLDVLGGLSGGPTDASPAWILDYKVYDPQDDDEIDCIMGFTTRCVYILSQIAELVRRWEPERLRITRRNPDAWVPSRQMEMSVASLDVDVRDSMVQPPRPCAHLHRSGDFVHWDLNDMTATNEAYHWAALVHLHRRVLGKPTSHPDVQGPVQHIIHCIRRVSVGGTAENCLLFPLFTAGCECLDDSDRKDLLRRILSLEGTGMMQITRARALMQKTWGTSKSWETLLTTEFIG